MITAITTTPPIMPIIRPQLVPFAGGGVVVVVVVSTAVDVGVGVVDVGTGVTEEVVVVGVGTGVTEVVVVEAEVGTGVVWVIEPMRAKVEKWLTLKITL